MGKEDCTFLEVRPRERFVFGRRCSSDDDNNDEEEDEKDDDDNYDDDDDDNDSNSAFYPSGVPKWGSASAGKEKADMVYSVSG